ncbi:MAG: hypothetical protein AAF483_27235 [Planctomycetota bacterium]
MRPLFRIILRSLACIALVLVFVFAYSMWSLATPHSEQEAWRAVEKGQSVSTLSGILPESATKFCYARSSVGLGGRFKAFAVDGSPNELIEFARAEFAAHWDAPKTRVTESTTSPFSSDQISFLEEAYAVDLEWLRASVGRKGTIFRAANGEVSHMPTIFVDPSGLLYFVMTD